MKEKKSFGKWLKEHKMDIAAYGGLVICIIIFSIVPPMFGESIWTAEKLANLMSNVIVLALLSVGAVFVYSLGNMDISVGGQVRVYALLMVLFANMTGSLLPGILISLLISESPFATRLSGFSKYTASIIDSASERFPKASCKIAALYPASISPLSSYIF